MDFLLGGRVIRLSHILGTNSLDIVASHPDSRLSFGVFVAIG